MGIYIKGMEMPESCYYCPFADGVWQKNKRCLINGKEMPRDGRDVQQNHINCPLIEIPPHGRLIDADALMNEFEKAQRTMQQHGREYSCSFLSSSQELSTEWYCVEDMLENAPTIIPAEEGET